MEHAPAGIHLVSGISARSLFLNLFEMNVDLLIQHSNSQLYKDRTITEEQQ
jgi:hypothetical protein